MAEIIVYHNQQKKFCLPLQKDRFTIGRSSKCDLILQNDEVSRLHATLQKTSDGFVLQDHSQAGTSLNQTKISKAVLLKPEDQIQILDWTLTYSKNSKIQDQKEKELQTQITQILSEMPEPDHTKVLNFEKESTYKILKPVLFIDDPQKGTRQYIVKSQATTIGNQSDCDVMLQDEYVSSKHAQLQLSDKGFLLKDLNSTNGILLDQAKVSECYLKSGDQFQIGKTKITVDFSEDGVSEVVPSLHQEFCGMIGDAKVMRVLFEKIKMAAATDMTVLVLGETGSGKEMVARAVHDLSTRRDRPYIALNCAAISSNLIESELFGHEKGAFTGAEKRHLGVFEQAQNGTVFLDEVGELPLELQAKLLRVLEYQTLRRVGGSEEIQVNVRIVAATHQDLASQVAQKNFREDLFFRLYVLPLIVPSLRERKEDVSLLVNQFIQLSSPGQTLKISNDALSKLKKYHWPGNVRELKNTILRAIAFCNEDTIHSKHIEFIQLPFQANAEPKNVNDDEPLLGTTKQDIEKARIQKALDETGGDKDKAAQILGMGRSTLFRKIKDLGIN